MNEPVVLHSAGSAGSKTMALRAGVYLVLGGIGGVALAENKELVPTVCSCVPVCACNCAVHPGRPGGEATQ